MRIQLFKQLLLLIVFILSNLTLAQVSWTKYPGNPVLSGQPGTWYAYLNMSCVLYNADSSRYEMWFTAGAQAEYPYSIGFAWSYDGISWIVYSNNPVLAPTPGQWDGYTVLAPYVLRENGQYKMYYTGSTANLLVRIGYATSSDGIEWTKHASNPILVPGTEPWESGNVAYGCVMPYLNGYKMWYSGGSANFSQSGIGHATSPDGINWQKDTVNNPVLTSGASGQWDRIVFGPRILHIDDLFYMFYTGEISAYQSDKIGLATSTDGLVWTKHPANPVLQPTAGQWDGNRTILGGVLMDVDTLKTYYAGTNGPNWEIGLATSFPFIPVPVELISFTATSNGKEVMLNWSTATELNNLGFEVQRSSEGKEFLTVGFIKGCGTSSEQHNYTFSDRNLNNGNFFYRLKQVDFNGSFEYSDEIEVEWRAFNSYLLEQNYPNPFNPLTTIGYGIQEKSNVKITILNIIGEEVAVILNEEKEAGYHQIDFNAANLPSGVYFYQLQAGSSIYTKKMILLK